MFRSLVLCFVQAYSFGYMPIDLNLSTQRNLRFVVEIIRIWRLDNLKVLPDQLRIVTNAPNERVPSARSDILEKLDREGDQEQP